MGDTLGGCEKVVAGTQETAMVALIEQHREELTELCRRYHVERLELFGSAATAEGFRADSDVDFLVEFLPIEPVEHARAYFGLLDALRELLGRRVDLLETGAVKNPYFLAKANQSRTVLYADRGAQVPS